MKAKQKLMFDCSKCVFSKCCQDNSSNPKHCSYFEDSYAKVIVYLSKNGMWEDGSNNGKTKLTDEKLEEALQLKQKDRVNEAKEDLRDFFLTITAIVLLVATVLALWVGDEAAWSKAYLQVLSVVLGSIFTFFLLKGIYVALRFVLNNVKTIIEGK